MKIVLIGLMMFTVILVSGCATPLNCDAICMSSMDVTQTRNAVMRQCVGEDNTNFSKPFDCRLYAYNKSKEFCMAKCN